MSNKYTGIYTTIKRVLSCDSCDLELEIRNALWVSSYDGVDLHPYCKKCADSLYESRPVK